MRPALLLMEDEGDAGSLEASSGRDPGRQPATPFRIARRLLVCRALPARRAAGLLLCPAAARGIGNG